MRDAAVPCRAGALGGIAAQRARRGIVELHVELRVVFERLARFRIDALGPVQIVHVLRRLDEPAVGAIERVEESVAREMADDLARLAVDGKVVEHVHADLVVVPRIVRRVLEIPGQLARVDVQRDDGVRVQVVAGPRFRVV